MVKGDIQVYDKVYDMRQDESGLRIPRQAAPIDRSPAGAAAFGSQAGVDASIDWGNLLGSVAQAALPFVASAI